VSKRDPSNGQERGGDVLIALGQGFGTWNGDEDVASPLLRVPWQHAPVARSGAPQPLTSCSKHTNKVCR
jgi:hypothetical protein